MCFETFKNFNKELSFLFVSFSEKIFFRQKLKYEVDKKKKQCNKESIVSQNVRFSCLASLGSTFCRSNISGMFVFREFLDGKNPTLPVIPKGLVWWNGSVGSFTRTQQLGIGEVNPNQCRRVGTCAER